MAKYEENELSKLSRLSKLNFLTKKIKLFEDAKIRMKKAQEQYSEIVFNQCDKAWEYTNYSKLTKNIQKIKSSSNIIMDIENIDEKYFNLFSISRKVFEELAPKNIKDLTLVFAMGCQITCNSQERYEICLQKRNLPKYLESILKNSYNQILFHEQIQKILFKITKNKNNSKYLFKFLWRARYLLNKYEIMDKYEKDEKFSITNYVKNKDYDTYAKCIKIFSTSLQEHLQEQNLSKKDIDKIIDILILGILNSCSYRKAIKCAKQFYILANLGLNNYAKMESNK